MAIYSIVMSIGFMIAFPVVGSLVQSSGLALCVVRDWRGVARRARAVERSCLRAQAP